MSSRGLLRLTLMSSRIIYLIFWFYYLKSILIMFSKCICIIKRNTGGFWLRPDSTLSEKIYNVILEPEPKGKWVI